MVGYSLSAQRGYKGKKGKKSDTQGYYAFSLGPSLPLGDYGGDDILSDKTGGAKTGLHINIANFGYKLMPNFGLAALVTVGANKFDAELLGSDDNDAYWVYGALMAGPLLSFDAGDQITVDFRPVAGLTYVAAPEINAGKNNSTVLVKSDQTTGFGFDVGASMRYHATASLDLGLNLDYFSTKPSFSDTYKGSEVTVSVLGITAGLAFRF